MDPATMIGAGTSVASTLASLFQQGQQNALQGRSIDVAQQGQQAQIALQREIMRQQREMSTAPQTDAQGNQMIYDPEKGWIPLLSRIGKSEQERGRAIDQMHAVETLGRGATERGNSFDRRITEGAAAAPLLEQMRNGYGAPTREGVTGNNVVAAATKGAETGDNARAGFTAAALRTGSGGVPLQDTLASLDRGQVSGMRGAIADSQAQSGPLYSQMLSDFNTSKLNPYDKLASRASNIEDVPMPSSNTAQTLDSNLLQRAVRGGGTPNAYAGMATQGGTNALIAAMGAQKVPAYGSAIGALGDNLMRFFKSNGPSGPDTPAYSAMPSGARPLRPGETLNDW